MKIGIVTDSASDLPNYLIEPYELEVVPSILVVDGKEYADGSGFSREDFYQQLSVLQSQPTTAAPSIGEFSARYNSLFSRGCDHLISIHIAGKLSTTVNSAYQAAQDYSDKITVVDSDSLSLGLGFQALAAAEAAENGLQAALQAIESTRRRLHFYAALDTMKYLKRSGRVPGAVAMLGSMLSIKPLIQITDGEVKAIGAVRTTRQANERMMNLLLQGGELERLAIVHSGSEPRAKEFLNTIMQNNSQSVPRDILIINITTVIGTHAGPNALGFVAVKTR